MVERRRLERRQRSHGPLPIRSIVAPHSGVSMRCMRWPPTWRPHSHQGAHATMRNVFIGLLIVVGDRRRRWVHRAGRLSAGSVDRDHHGRGECPRRDGRHTGRSRHVSVRLRLRLRPRARLGPRVLDLRVPGHPAVHLPDHRPAPGRVLAGSRLGRSTLGWPGWSWWSGQLGRPRPSQSIPGDVRRLASPGARPARHSDRVDSSEGSVGLSRRPTHAAPSRFVREGASVSVRCSAT